VAEHDQDSDQDSQVARNAPCQASAEKPADSIESINRELATHSPAWPALESFSMSDSHPSPSVSSDTATDKKRRTAGHAAHVATSTFLSLVMVLGLLLLVRFMVPGMVEKIRYSWHRGQLRAQHDYASQNYSRVSLESIEAASEHVSSIVGPTVVHISLLRGNNELSQAAQELAKLDSRIRLKAQGSGFVISDDGYILTNAHVVESAAVIEVTLSDGRKLPAKLVGQDVLTDVAVLKVDADNLINAEWGDSQQAIVGTPVWAIGSPFGLRATVSFGIISGKNRVDFSSSREVSGVPGGTAFGDMLQSDVVLHPGNSGGPLVNSEGKVVGMNGAILGDSFQGISFAIPSQVVKRIADEIIEHGDVQRPWLGVRLGELLEGERYNKSGTRKLGARILQFPRGKSPARDAGLKAGDIITRFDGSDVAGVTSLQKLIGSARVGDTVEIEYLRDGEQFSTEVVLAKRTIESR